MDARTATYATNPTATTTVTKVDVVQQPRAFNFYGHNAHLLLTFASMVLVQGTVRFVRGTIGAVYESESETINTDGDRFHWDVLSVGGAFEVAMGLFGIAIAAAAIFGYLVSKMATWVLFGLSVVFGLFAIAVFDFYLPAWYTHQFNDLNVFGDDKSEWKGFSTAGILTAFGYDLMLMGGQWFFMFALIRAMDGDVFRSGAYRRMGLVASVITAWTGIWMIVLAAISLAEFGNVVVEPVGMPPSFIRYPGVNLWIGIQMFLLGLFGIIITAKDHSPRERSMTLWMYPFFMFFNFICQLVFLVYHPLAYSTLLWPAASSMVVIAALNFLPAYYAILERRTAAQTYFFEQIEKTKVVTA